MSPVRNLRGIRVRAWIPPKTTAAYKVTVERSDGTIDDITSFVHMFEFEDGVTDVIGRFNFSIWNPNEDYTNVWTGMEIVRYYSDYAASGTTLRFRGRIEKVKHTNNQVNVDGRSEARHFIDITVTQNYDDKTCDFILKDLISIYGEGFTDTNVTASTTNLTTNWYQKPFWDCVKELAVAAGFDIYVAADLDFHFFEAGTVKNQGEAIVHDHNQMDVTDFAEDITQVKNRIIVYGATTDGIQIVYTAEDDTSQTAYGVREEIINDDNITSETQAQEYGDFILAKKKDPPQIGEVTGQLLASIQPGEQIRLSSPQNDIPPNYYDIISYKNSLNLTRGQVTKVKVNKEPRKFSHIISTMVNTQNQQKVLSINPFEMRYSRNFLYDTDEGTHTNTEITNGVLRPTAGAGTWLSTTRTLPSNITEAYLILVGTVLSGATISISGDSGLNYQVITDKAKIDMSTATGTGQKIKVVFNDATTEIDSLSILYKLQ